MPVIPERMSFYFTIDYTKYISLAVYSGDQNNAGEI